MMKIARYLKNDNGWAYEVRGSGREPKTCPSEASAIATAMSRAMLSGTSCEVYEHGDRIGYARFEPEANQTTWVAMA